MKMRNVRTAEKKRNVNKSNVSMDVSTTESFINQDEIAEREKTDVELLKITVVNDSNLPYIKAKLQSTLSYRFRSMEKQELDLKENFPYFFTHPTLVTRTNLCSTYFIS